MILNVEYFYNEDGEVTWVINASGETTAGDSPRAIANAIRELDSALKGKQVN